MSATAVAVQAPPRTRLSAVDALRGFVMLFMLVDHLREIVYAHHAVSDPMDALTIEPALFFTRLTSQICAPVFVALAGLGAYLHGQSHTLRETSMFLLKRGLLLILLEIAVVNLAWTVQHFPPTFYLQVIWALGLCMIVLAGLIHLPWGWRLTLGALTVVGHNLLDGVTPPPASPLHLPWTVLHQRALYDLGGGVAVRVSYPVLPWIGVILLGHAMGPWFARGGDPRLRVRRLCALGAAMIAAFVAVRLANLYGDRPWVHAGDGLRTVMSFLAATKYPPSLLFLLPTLGLGAILLALFERVRDGRVVPALAALGGAPMFFYLMHLYGLRLLYAVAVTVWGRNQGTGFGFDRVWQIWPTALVLAALFYLPTRWFASFKQRRKDIGWLSYL